MENVNVVLPSPNFVDPSAIFELLAFLPYLFESTYNHATKQPSLGGWGRVYAPVKTLIV
jgi:hypothetical protein